MGSGESIRRFEVRLAEFSDVAKHLHEIRDPIHVFVRLTSDERRVLDSRQLQRLRHVHQLAMSFLVYPGATHRRFEHSLGVMELADRVFGVVTRPDAVTDEVRKLLPEVDQPDDLRYWRRALRMAALCHDIGHLPFSHAAEKELLPDGWNHERLTRMLIESEEMKEIWNKVTPPLRPEDIVKLAIGPREAPDLNFTVWETILSEIITGDAFGVDRMDYLLRDSHHVGVPYGRFDQFRLIDTLRILPSPPFGDSDRSEEPALGVEEGGIQSAEALLFARYCMYSQVYFHPIRRIYDIHLKDFLVQWLPEKRFATDIESHLKMTDNEVMQAIISAARNSDAPGHDPARRIVRREHFRVLYSRKPDDLSKNERAGSAVFDAARAKFGEEAVRRDVYRGKGGPTDFPIKMKDGRVASAFSVSSVLPNVPVTAIEYVFIDPTIKAEATKWLSRNRDEILAPEKEEPL